jgi:hypothetical protein
MWTPDPLFLNQDSLERVESTIKAELDSYVKIQHVCCPENPKFCAKFGLGSKAHGIKFIYKQTLQVEVNCPEMDFDDFPLDTQKCGFLIKEMRKANRVKWSETSITRDSDETAVTSSDYRLSIKPAKQDKRKRTSGFYVTMKRKRALYIYSYFLPCGLMVFVSWTSFAVRVDAVPGRLGLLLTLLLMMINLTGDAASGIPSSDNICPLVLWIWLCISFVTFAIFEYFFILVILRFAQGGNKVSDERSKERLELRILHLDRGSLLLVPVLYIICVAIFVMKAVP